MSTILETTDAATGRGTTYGMAVGDVFLGAAAGTDQDWVAVTLTAGQTVTMGAVGIGGVGVAMVDPILRLHNAAGAVVATNDDGGPGWVPSLTYTAATSGTYYIDVRNLDAGSNYGLTVVAGSHLSLTPDLGAGVLYRDETSWSATAGTGVTLTWGFRDTGPAYDAEGQAAPFSHLSSAQQAAAQAALIAYGEVSGVQFTQVNAGGFTNDATILLGAYTSTTDGAGAFAYFPGSTDAASQDGDLWLNLDSVSDSDLAPGGYSWYVMLHELGHAMGLDHPGDYNAAPGVSITYANSAQFVQDSGQYSVMSYFDAVDTTPQAPNIYAQTLMMYDIRALQVMYGVNTAFHAGATTYGFHSTLAGSVYDFSTNATPLLCIWDGSGVDTIDVSGFAAVARIDLNDGTFSDVGGYRNNLSIAVDCVIENATGGRRADTLIGNEQGNRLKGGGGADTLDGGAGSDVLTGGNGSDRFEFALGDGRDRVADFQLGADLVELGSDLWGGLAKTATQVVSEFAVLRGGHVVLDFGVDELHLSSLTTTTGLAAQILIL